jgi:hypothetical protein
MKTKLLKISKYLLVFSVILFSIKLSFAATLELKKIGNLDTNGKVYPSWWYNGPSPVLSGVAQPSSEVSIKIGEVVGKANSDTSGAWSFATNLESGDHNIEISQGSEKISFVLHLGQTMPSGSSVTSPTSAEGETPVPDTGFDQYVALSLGIGLVLLSTYFYFSAGDNKKKIFESRMIKE